MSHKPLFHTVFAAVAEIFPNASANDLQNIFFDIKSRYEEKGRFHHTLARVAGTLEKIDALQWDNRDAAIASALYQDIIFDAAAKFPYNRSQQGNEWRSTQYASELLDRHGRGDLVPIVHQNIMATLDHAPNPVLSQDILKFCDIDLSVYGSKHTTNYEESAHLSEPLYTAINVMAESVYADKAMGLSAARAREHWLGDKLAMLNAGGALFKTEAYAHLNDQAAKNIEEELRLSQSVILPRATQLAEGTRRLKVDNSFPFKPAFA